jgi:hypothetical protein
MSWFQKLVWKIKNAFGIKNRDGWDGFKAVDQAIVDTPEEFRDRNVS